jgi:aminoglycoside phosphotransferase (APT) family kinase protein
LRQPSEDRALYYRQLRDTIRTALRPELTSAAAIDATGLIDRILTEFIVEEESAGKLSCEYGVEFEKILDPAREPRAVTPIDFNALRARAAELVSRVASSDSSPHDLAAARELVDVERRFLECQEALRGSVLAESDTGDAGPSASACSVSEAWLTDYLRRRLDKSPQVTVRSMSVVPGGRSKETIVVCLDKTVELPHEVVLRMDRPVSLLNTRAADEFGVIKAVYDYGGVPVPEPFFCDELGDTTVLVMERVAGTKAGEFFPDLAAPTAHRAEIGEQLAAALARLHSMPLERLSSTKLDGDDGGVTPESLVGTVEAIVGRIDELSGQPNATVYMARRWLIDNAAAVAQARRVCLLQGDFGLHNTIVDGPRITALVDWEAAAVGPPEREMAAAWDAASSLVGWDRFVECYLTAGGQPADVDPRPISYYRVLSALGGFMTSKMGGHLFRTGAKRDLVTAHSGLDSNFRCARNLARALQDAIASTGS